MYDKFDEVSKFFKSCRLSYESTDEKDKKEEIVLNAIASLKEYGIKVCRNSLIVNILEKFIIENQTPAVVGCLFRALVSNLDEIVTDPHASHLLEKVILACKCDEIANDEMMQFYADQFAKYMWLHYPDYFENNIGIHGVRLFFQFFTGVYVNKEGQSYSIDSVEICRPMQPDYMDRWNELVNRFLLSPHVVQLVSNKYISPTLQILLIITSKLDIELFGNVCNYLMKSLCDIQGHISRKTKNVIIPDSFSNESQCFFIECLIQCLPESKLLKYFHKKYFKVGQKQFVAQIFKSPYTCAIFKAGIKQMKNCRLLLENIQNIQKSLKDCTNFQCGNVFLNTLKEFIGKIPLFISDQAEMRNYKNVITEIIRSLASNSDGSLSLMTFLKNGIKETNQDGENEECKKYQTRLSSLVSSMLFQEIIRCYDPIPNTINKMINQLSSDDIESLSKDGSGSRVIEALIQSKSFAVGHKLAMLEKLSSSQLSKLACDKFGSRILDGIWNSLDQNLIELIRSRLDSEKERIRYHKIGLFVYSKFFGYVPKQPKKDNKNQQSSRQRNFNMDVRQKRLQSSNPKFVSKKQKIE